MKASLKCTKITDYFDFDKFSENIDNDLRIRALVNRSIGNGNEETKSVTPLLKRLFENAVKNTKSESKGHRHDELIK